MEEDVFLTLRLQHRFINKLGISLLFAAHWLLIADLADVPVDCFRAVTVVDGDPFTLTRSG